MRPLIQKLLRENISKLDFYKQNNINPEELSHAGRGDFGDAYYTGDGRILKITSSKSEFRIAKELVGKDIPALDGFAKFYFADIVDGNYYIIMEELDEDSHIEDLYYQLEELLSNEGLPIQYLNNLDTDDLDLDEELITFINDMEDINRSYRYLGIEASDIKPDNLGYDKNGKLKAFDIDDKVANESIMKENPEPKFVSINFLKGLLKNTANKSAHKVLNSWISQGGEKAKLSPKQYQLLQDIKRGGVDPKMYSTKN